MQEHLDYETERQKKWCAVPTKTFVWKLVGILSGVIAVVLAAVLAFTPVCGTTSKPQNRNLRLSFIEKDYLPR